ncbi:MAG: hypothetical protein RQ753_06060 [Desulfurivibrionaceae bacterium]|nr:hypothetical protein [Desulfurivibrionaceae bacterium]
MILDKLQFGTFREIEPDIMEITIKDGVELDRAKLSVVAVGLCEKYQNRPYAILANRDNVFFQFYEAMEVYDNLNNLKGMANLVDDENARDIRLKDEKSDKIRTFQDRRKAISWLKTALGKA